MKINKRMLPWGESVTLSEELTRESAHGGVPRLLLAVQVDKHGDGGADGGADGDEDDDAVHKGVPGGLRRIMVVMPTESSMMMTVMMITAMPRALCDA